MYFVQVRSRKYGWNTFVATMEDVGKFLDRQGIPVEPVEGEHQYHEGTGQAYEVVEVEVDKYWEVNL